MTLDARVAVDAVSLDVRVRCADEETLVVVGPNGAGKTTLLRAIAGVIPIDRGSVVIAGETVDDVPPHLRRVGYVPQGNVLFPHLDARDNIAFGLRCRGSAPSFQIAAKSSATISPRVARIR